MRRKSCGGTIGIILVFLISYWFIQPAIHDLMQRCPVHPDGIPNVLAVPSYSRSYGMSCSQCHSAYPILNAYGRQFKLNGYVPDTPADSTLKTADGALSMEKIFPWGMRIRSRPFDQATQDDEFKLTAIESLTLWISGGNAARHVSWFGEMDADSDSRFTPVFGELQLGYHPSNYLNFVVARRGFYVMDPYQTLNDMGSTTLAGRAVSGGRLDQGSFSLETLDETKQTAMLFGQALEPRVGALYYAAGVAANRNNDRGNGFKDGNMRIAFDTLKGFVIGGFGTFGKEGPLLQPTGSTDTIKFYRFGADTVVEIGNFTGRGAFLCSMDKDQDTSLRETNRAAYVELMYSFKRAGKLVPVVVPLVREDWYQTANGDREFAYITAQLAYYFTSNVKAFVEYSGDTKQDVTSQSIAGSPASKDHRWIGQIEVGF